MVLFLVALRAIPPQHLLDKEHRDMVAFSTDCENQPKLAVTYREAGNSLGVCERVVWQLVKDGRLKAVRIGRSVRIPVSELERFVSESADAA